MNYFILGPDIKFRAEEEEQIDALVGEDKVKLLKVDSLKDYKRCIKEIAKLSKSQTAINLICLSHGMENGKMFVGIDRYPEKIIEDINTVRLKLDSSVVLEKIRADFLVAILDLALIEIQISIHLAENLVRKN